MTKQKYLLLTVGVTILWCYLVATVVIDRWMSVGEMYQEAVKKEDGFLSPEKLAEEKLNLLRKRQSLMSSLSKEDGQFEQNQTGVIEYLNSCARNSHIQFLSLIPSESSSNDLVKEIGFKVTSLGRYHKIGRLVNLIENGSLLVRMKKVELSEEMNSPNLTVAMEGTAYIVAKR